MSWGHKVVAGIDEADMLEAFSEKPFKIIVFGFWFYGSLMKNWKLSQKNGAASFNLFLVRINQNKRGLMH